MPPIVHKNIAIYVFSSGKYEPQGWLFGHGSIRRFAKDQKPLVRAYDLDSGDEVWTTDFSEYGFGGDDAGACLMDGKLYYSCFLGYSPRKEEGSSIAKGITAALDPESGKVLWLTDKYAVHSGCTVSGKDGRLYLGGYSRVDAKSNRVWCLDARDGSLIWKSDPLVRAIHVITVGQRFLFTHAQYQDSYLIDKNTGKIVSTLSKGYKCTRFTLSEPYLLGSNMDIHDLSDFHDIKLVSSGPRLDPSECIGAVVSNGRIFYTAHGSGVQVSQTCELKADSPPAPKRR